MRKILLNIICLFVFCSNIFSQRIEDFKHESLAEKIYLQLDNNVYTTNKTIWFKAVLANAVTHNQKIVSGVLYVDLINSDGKVVDSKIFKIKNGIGKGHINLDRSYSEGNYQIRAYTEWNKNFQDNFITKKNIKILSSISNTLDVKSSSSITKSLSENIEFPSNPIDTISVQFFPEGGKMINNLPCKLGFKALDNYGKGVQIEGELINGEGEAITRFKSNKLGMGNFNIDRVQLNEDYKVRVRKKGLKQFMLNYSLPQISEFGETLSVSKIKKVITVVAKSNRVTNQKVILKASVRGKEYYSNESKLINGQYIFNIPMAYFPNGIIVFTLLNEAQKPISERLFFNSLEDFNLKIDASINNLKAKKRELLTLSLDVSNYLDSSVVASNSVLVLDRNIYGRTLTSNENILSYFLLSSDIKGEIEQPGLYFAEEDKLNIDDLMITQGWRNYKYKLSPKKLNHGMERGLNISGIINVKGKTEKKKKLDIMLLTFGDDSAVYSGSVNVPGSFNFQLGDLYGDTKEIVLKPNGLTKKQENNYKIVLSKKKKPKINFFDTEQNFVLNHSLVDSIIKEDETQSRILNKYYTNLEGVNQLDEVVVDAYKMTPKRKEIFNKYGKPNVVIESKEILKKKAKNTRGLLSVMTAFQDKVTINRIRDSLSGLIYYVAKTTRGGKDYTTLVLVDGIPVKQTDYFLIEKIMPQEVTSFEIIDNPPGFKQLYADAFNTSIPWGYFPGSIIAIYTKSGKGIYSALNIKKDINIKTIPVFSVEKEFYTPNYSDSYSKNFIEPDLRSTIYWNPDIITSKSKVKKIEYSHSDNIGDFIVIIESITESGQIGYKTLSYTIIESEN